MNPSMMKGVMVGGIAMVVLGASGVTYQQLTKPKFAQVVTSKEVFETVVTPREHCEDVQVKRQAPVKDEHRIAGTAIGAIAGGVIGHQIGGGSGKKLATVGGAAAGGYAGNQVQKNMQQKDVVTTTERQCKTVQDKSQKLVGYNVTYRLDGKEGTVRTSFKPGDKLPVKDGQVDTTPPTPEAKS
ncbi:MAG TPA: glycine zipper 2TM domain-containing protein [Burkholderiaceae bacterium]|nr:glycine zipper 2TM domain-containing protein [Burkholderiaceae bacterium]